MDLNNILSKAHYGINEIKLRDLLAVRSKVQDDPKIQTMFPPIEIGSITLVDQIVLLSLGQILSTKRIIEIGTYLGYSAALFAMNFKQSEIISIDLPKSGDVEAIAVDETQIYTDGNSNDNYLRKKQHFDGEIYLKQLPEYLLSNVRLLKKDSTKLNFKQEFNSADFVFIDGGHDLDIVKKDTENARSIISKGVIVWHDYGSSIHSDVTHYLQNVENRKIFHVLGSLCAFELIGFE